MTIVRIVLADPRSGRVPERSAVNGQQLIVLADDAGHRAVPLWLRVIDAKLLWGLLERPAGDVVMAGVLEETAARLTLLGDWPEHLHPASAHGLPSAEDLDRADTLGRAVAGLPPGQRQAVTLFYYADQPESRIAGTPGAAKASLHKARRRLRAYITAHRPDLIPITSRRTPMTAVRIAHADPGQNTGQSALWCSPMTPGTGRCRSGCPAPACSGACWPAPATAPPTIPATMPGR